MTGTGYERPVEASEGESAMRSCTRRIEAGAGKLGDEALGAISSPAGSCAWHVLRCGRSVREWALRQGWGGQEQAQGMLVGVSVRIPAYDRLLCESQSITSLALRSGGNTG
jgi:hypothetical protein